jgi:hypothetical protein
MAKTKSKAKVRSPHRDKQAAQKKGAFQLTREDFEKNIGVIRIAIEGLAGVVAYADECAEEPKDPFYRIGALAPYLLQHANRGMIELYGRLDEQFSEVDDAPITFTEADFKQFRDALGPLSAFVDLFAEDDPGQNRYRRRAVDIANAASLLKEAIADSTILFDTRFAEAGRGAQ